MKIAIMGSGGVGGYYGGRLAATGSDVTFIARGKHLEAIKTKGLIIEGPNSAHIFPAKATDDPSTIGEVDLVILSVKLWDTESALNEIKPIVGPSTAILSLQNGITKDEVIAKIYSKEHILGGICYVTSNIEAPGVIKQVGQSAKIIFGELDNKPSKRTEDFLQACLKAGLEASISHDIQKTIWEKFVYLVGFSAITSATRLSLGPIMADPKTRKLYQDIMQEVVDVGLKSQIHLDKDFAQNRIAFAEKLSGEIRASMALDLERGNRLEVDWLSGTVVRLGEKLGIATPYNRAIAALLSPYSNGKPS